MLDIKQLTDSEYQFKDTLNKKGKFSLWSCFIVILMIVPDLTYWLSRSAQLYCGKPFEVRCEIPAMEKSNWTFEEIIAISQPNSLHTNCSYYDYDYTIFMNITYKEALQIIAVKNNPKLIPCSGFVYSHEVKEVTMVKDFQLYCSRAKEMTLILAPYMGFGISYIFISPFADLLGRKHMLSIGMRFLFLTTLLVNLANTSFLLILASFVQAISYIPIKVAIEALVIELFTTTPRRIFYFLIGTVSASIAHLLTPTVAEFYPNWKYLRWIYTSAMMLLAFPELYIPESPRWVFMKNHEVGLVYWEHLQTPSKQCKMCRVIQQFRKNVGYKKHMYGMSEAFQYRFWFTFALVTLAGALCLHNYSEIMADQTYGRHYILWIKLRGMTDILGLSIACSLLILIGQKRPLLGLTIFAAVIAFATPSFEDKWKRTLIYYLLEAVSISVYAMSKLLAIENIPTSHRCTLLGLYGLAHSVMSSLAIVAIYIYRAHIFFMIMGIVFVCTFMFTLLSYDDESNLYDTFESYQKKKNSERTS